MRRIVAVNVQISETKRWPDSNARYRRLAELTRQRNELDQAMDDIVDALAVEMQCARMPAPQFERAA